MRVTNSRDFVCMVPPAITYRHVGETAYFDAYGLLHTALTTQFRIIDVLNACFRDALRFRLFRNLLGYHSSVHVVELMRENRDSFYLVKK